MTDPHPSALSSKHPHPHLNIHIPPQSNTSSSSPPPLPSTSPASPPSSSPPTPTSPVVLDSDSLSSILLLKQRHDELHTDNLSLTSQLSSLQSTLSRLTSQSSVDESEWQERVTSQRADYERLLKDFALESEKGRKAEERERRMREEWKEREREWEHREKLLELTQADLENERKLTGVLREKVKEREREKETEESEEGQERGEGERVRGMMEVENVVLRRKVERLELELDASRKEVEEQRRMNERQEEVIKGVKEHMTILSKAKEENDGGEREVDNELESLEVVLLKEKLVCERVGYWKRERRLYCLALGWMVAMLIVCIISLIVS